MKKIFNLPKKKISIKDLPDEVNDYFFKNSMYFVAYMIGITAIFLSTFSLDILKFELLTIVIFLAFFYFVYYQFTRDIIMVAEGTIEEIEKKKRSKKLYIRATDLVIIINVPIYKVVHLNDTLRIYFNKNAVSQKNDHIIELFSYIILKTLNYDFKATSFHKSKKK